MIPLRDTTKVGLQRITTQLSDVLRNRRKFWELKERAEDRKKERKKASLCG